MIISTETEKAFDKTQPHLVENISENKEQMRTSVRTLQIASYVMMKD
jgi:hypothetical protein